MSFVGSIVGTQGEQVEVAFDIDKTAAGGKRYGFAPATGNLMYCMPQKGTKTSLYIGNGDEAQGIATGCIRTNGSTCEGTGSPEKKSFRSEHGKGMDLYPQRMGLDGGETGKITFEDETGTTIESNGGLVLMAKEGIRLESMTGIAMQGMSDIMALHSEGASSLCVNGSVDMLGRLAGISASKYTGYPPYDDAPKEGEFDWDGFTRNLAIGLGVVAVCAIGAAISIATLGAGSILAGAFIGAGIGALSTTAMKAGEEISTGNVRSAGEALRDVGISAVSGFITGAIGAKFPGMNHLVEGVVDTAVSAGERLAYAVFDDSMSWDEKWAYAFDPGQMVADFVTGVVIGEFLDGIMAATQNKLRSIFANNDAAMREALESGEDSVDDIVKGVENGDILLSNNIQKGNYGEMKMDVYFKSQGYERISLDRVTDLNAPTHQGIDGVYYNLDGHPPYIIGEAKYGSSRLAILADGTPQMSDKWIIDRLENAVGEGVANDIKMEMILNPDNVGSILVHVSSNGEIDITKLIDGIKQ